MKRTRPSAMDVAARGLDLTAKTMAAIYDAGRIMAPLLAKEGVRLIDQFERLADSAERAVDHLDGAEGEE